MKLTIVLLTTCFLHVSAGVVSQGISFSGKNVALASLFTSVEKQTGVVFIYKKTALDSARVVTIEASNIPLQQFLRQVFINQPVDYEVKGKNILVFPKATPGRKEISSPDLAVPPIDVTGRVVTDKGEPVSGASVRVKNTDKGVSTNERGEFVLTGIEENATLQISGANIESFEWKVGGNRELKLTARIKFKQEDEVVVSTGYEKITKERFVGSYSQLDSAAYHRRAGMNIIDRLDGTVAGLIFNKKGVDPNPLKNIQIRGVSTLDNPKSPDRAPLVIVDNFPFRQDLSTINPNDVESVTVLKDAAATSIWGAQAGNGVIVITTKKGKFNQSFQFSAGSNVSILEKPDLYYYPSMSVADFVDVETFLFTKGQYDNDLANTIQWPVISPVVEILAQKRSSQISEEDAARQITTLKNADLRRDLDKYVYRKSVLQQHYINLGGGTTIFNYNLSAGYNHSLNTIQRSKADNQISLRSTFGIRPSKGLDITLGTSFTQGNGRSATFSLPAKIYPYYQLADAQGYPLAIANGRRLGNADTAGGGRLLDWHYRPLEEVGLVDRNDMDRLLSLNLNMGYRFTRWLNAAVSYQYNTETTDRNNYRSPATFTTRNLINSFTNLSQSLPDLRNPVPVGGILDLVRTNSASENIRFQLNFNEQFGSDHSVSAMVAAERGETKLTEDGSRLYGYNKTNDTYKGTVDYATVFPLYGGVDNRQISGGTFMPAQYSRFVSLLGNASYTYKNRYTLYGSARKDGSNVFGVNANRKWKPLWSTGASWAISDESFFRVKPISSLRLRISYGFTGNPGNASGFATILYQPTPVYVTNLTGAGPGDPPNPDLRWEKVGIVNTGLDYSLFNKRISGSLDLWNKKSTDVIAYSFYPASAGVEAMTANVANLKGNGFDITVSAKVLDGPLQWQASWGFSYAKMIVSKFYNRLKLARDFINYGLNGTEGKIAYGISSYRWAGLDPATGDPRGIFKKEVSTNYEAIFNDSVGNQIFHGSAIPLYFGYFGNSFSWKKFTLSANITYRLNFYFRKPSISYSELAFNLTGHADYTDRWQKPGDERYTTVPSMVYPLNSNRDAFYQNSEVNILRGDNIRLQDIRLQYNIDKQQIKYLPVKSLSLFVYLNNLNLILWRKNKSNLDPDFVGAGQTLAVPISRSWTVGLNLNF